MAEVQKVVPFLWFDGQAQAAAELYVSLFSPAEICSSDAGSTTFRVAGSEFIAFNGGPHFQFSPAISLFVLCDDQAEIDRLWAKLGDGGKQLQCGWLTDRFGLSWQIVPKVLRSLLSHPDPVRAKSAREAMLKMTKLDIAVLQRAGQAPGP